MALGFLKSPFWVIIGLLLISSSLVWRTAFTHPYYGLLSLLGDEEWHRKTYGPPGEVGITAKKLEMIKKNVKCNPGHWEETDEIETAEECIHALRTKCNHKYFQYDTRRKRCRCIDPRIDCSEKENLEKKKGLELWDTGNEMALVLTPTEQANCDEGKWLMIYKDLPEQCWELVIKEPDCSSEWFVFGQDGNCRCIMEGTDCSSEKNQRKHKVVTLFQTNKKKMDKSLKEA